MENIELSVQQYKALLSRLDELNHGVTAMRIKSDSEERYITNIDLRKQLQVSKRTEQRWRDTGRLPFIQIGKKIYYEVETILKSFRVGTNNPGEVENQPADENVPEKDISQMECLRCPLFVILNS
jgi:hypothetical protein